MADIGVVGWYGHGNCGDESYKLSFPKLFPQHRFTFSEKPSPPYRDAYILGGGDVICDDYINILKSVPKKHIMSATMSSQKDISDFGIVAVRDFASMSIASMSGVKSIYTPDFAFALDFDAKKGKELIRQKFKALDRDLYSNLVVVVVNAHLSPDLSSLARDSYLFQHMSYELAKAIDSTSASFMFIPFGTNEPWDDRLSNAWVASKCKFWKKNVICYDTISVQDTIDIIAAADAVISSRLHSTIFSCITATPFVDITHNHKNLGFLETTSLLKHSVKYEGVDAVTIVNKLKIALGSAEAKDELNKVSEKQKSILKEFANNVSLV